MGLLNMFGIQKKTVSQKNVQREVKQEAPTFPERRLERTAEYYNHRVRSNGYSPAQQAALNKEMQKQKVDLSLLKWKEIPGYQDWVMQTAEDLVINLLSQMDLDGHLQIYPGGIIYLDPTGRYFFPSIFFMSAYDYTDTRVPGFVLDVSRFDNPADVQRFLVNNVKRRDTLEFINLNLSDYKMGEMVRNPMRELYV